MRHAIVNTKTKKQAVRKQGIRRLSADELRIVQGGYGGNYGYGNYGGGNYGGGYRRYGYGYGYRRY